MGATHFLMKRLPKVATEMALHVLAYNLTRVMNIVGVKPPVPGGDPGLSCGLSWRFQVTQNDLWELQERLLQNPAIAEKANQRPLRVLASQSEVALDRSETFLRNQDPTRTLRGQWQSATRQAISKVVVRRATRRARPWPPSNRACRSLR